MRTKSTGQMAYIPELAASRPLAHSPARPALTIETVQPPAVGLAVAMGASVKAYCAGNWLLNPLNPATQPQITYRKTRTPSMDFTEYLAERASSLQWFDGAGWNPLMTATVGSSQRPTLRLHQTA